MFRRNLRIGGYVITPLGQAVFLGLFLILALIVTLIVTGGEDKVQHTGDIATPLPTLQATEAPAPTSTPAAPEVSVLDALTTDTASETDAEATPAPVTDGVVTIRVLGEIRVDNEMLKSAYSQSAGTFDFTTMLSMISGVVGNADYTIADVEGVISSSETPSDFGAAGDKVVTPSAILDALHESGVDMVNLANDHALDMGWEGLAGTIAAVQDSGLAYVGAAEGKAESSPYIVEIDGARVAFLSYTSQGGSGEKLLGKLSDEASLFATTNSNCKTDISAARAAGADIVIAILSWGTEGENEPNDEQAALAKVLVSAGCDVIVGYGPRAVQPAFWLEDKGTGHRTLCICATGNFLCDGDEATDSGMIFEFSMAPDATGAYTLISARYIPTYIWEQTEENGLTRFRALSIGEYVNQTPEGMNDDARSRMNQLWNEIQGIMGDGIATVAAY